MGHSPYDARIRRLISAKEELQELLDAERRARRQAENEAAWYRNLVDLVGAERNRQVEIMKRMRTEGRA